MSVKWISLKAILGQEATLKTCLEELGVASRNESGCLEYRVFQEKGMFYVLEQYENASALDAHKSSAHFIKAKTAFATLVEAKASQELEELIPNFT